MPENQSSEEAEAQTMPFRMVVSDVAFVRGQGVIIMGHVETGLLYPGDIIRLEGIKHHLLTGVRSFNIAQKIADVIQAGDDATILLLRDVLPEQVKVGMVVTKQGEG
jgi:translation elongation factor EF-Tu-like GTPase